jgi:hypothetical protein
MEEVALPSDAGKFEIDRENRKYEFKVRFIAGCSKLLLRAALAAKMFTLVWLSRLLNRCRLEHQRQLGLFNVFFWSLTTP